MNLQGLLCSLGVSWITRLNFQARMLFQTDQNLDGFKLAYSNRNWFQMAKSDNHYIAQGYRNYHYPCANHVLVQENMENS